MTDNFKYWVLKNIPTKLLLKAFKAQRNPRYKAVYDSDLNILDDYTGCPDFRRYDDYDVDMRIKIIMPRFAFWNPYKGHGCSCYFSVCEVKQELNKREHISR